MQSILTELRTIVLLQNWEAKEIEFLKSIGFIPPQDGILNWVNLDTNKSFKALNLKLLFDQK